ncbi:Pentatricopeptide (PPR) repeat protein [Arachis hypogaea]|nr:Pentatricopeptide (PPR) repeat protein [Arachis hypogaea]
MCSTLLDEMEERDAREFFEGLLAKNCNIDIYNIMIHELIKKGFIDEVMALVSKMKGNSYLPNFDSYNPIIMILFHRNMNKEAWKLLREIQDLGLLNKKVR